MRSIWNGAISFGLVSIPIKLFNATENHALSFRQIHTADGGRIRYRKVCELDEQEVRSADIGKGYEDADGAVIPITDDDLAALPLPTARTIEIVAFVPLASIDPLQMEQAYYLSANGVPAAKPYTLLREALSRSRKVAIAKFALRGRERLGMLRVVDDVIALHGLLWPDEIRGPEGAAPEGNITVRDAELDLADTLMDTLGEVDLNALHDDYREAVEELIAAKTENGGAVSPPPAEGGGDAQVLDLMAALENSVRAAKNSHGGSTDDSDKAPAEVTQLGSRKKVTASKTTEPGPRTKAAPAKATATAKTTEPNSRKKAAPAKESAAAQRKSAAAQKKTTAAKTTPTKATAARSTPAKSTPAKSTPAKRTASTAKKSTATTKKAPTKKAAAKKAPARKRTSA